LACATGVRRQYTDKAAAQREQINETEDQFAEIEAMFGVSLLLVIVILLISQASVFSFFALPKRLTWLSASSSTNASKARLTTVAVAATTNKASSPSPPLLPLVVKKPAAKKKQIRPAPASQVKTRKPLFFFDVFGRLDELSDRIDKLEQKAAGVVAFLVLAAIAYCLRMNACMDAMEQRTNKIRLEDKAEAKAKRLEDKAVMINLSYATLRISIAVFAVPAIIKKQGE